MHVAVACGGTGGHIFPGLATADELIHRGHEVTLWLAGKDVENEAVGAWPGKVHTVPARGLPSGLSVSSGIAAFNLIRAIKNVKIDMSKNRPDILLAMGSYASVGPVGAAIRMGVPFVMHESNVIPGRAVKMLSRWAVTVAGCFEETRFYLRRRNLEITGMPLRREILDSAAQSNQPAGCFRVLIMGGSRGAVRINELAGEALIALHGKGLALQVVHLTGEKDRERMVGRYHDAGVPAHVLSFTRDIGALYRQSDFAICRAGAATCAELSAFGLPSLLIPYPYAIHDHQTANARAMEKVGAADMVPEADVTVEWLTSYIAQMISRVERRKAMSEAAKSRATGNGAVKLADLIERIASEVPHARR